MKTSRKRVLGVALGLAFSGASLTAGMAFAETVSVYTYHNHPPFVSEGGKGLSYDFIEALNKKADGARSFKLEVVSRGQIDKLIASPDFNGAVAWVSPVWFKDKDRTVYLWSSPILEDANVVLSNGAQKLDYKDPASLKGKQFGGISGHKYAGIDELVASGDVKREDADKERTNLRKLEAGRIEATLLPRSTATFLLKEMGLTTKLYVAPTPHSTYSRQMLIAKGNPGLQKFVNAALAAMEKDSGWQATLGKYGAK